ncbi:MAG: DUF1186 domain-containing protein [Alphaproteobacteria bacterium]
MVGTGGDEDELTLAEELFLEFAQSEGLPAEAMAEAIECWEECRGFFLETLRGYAAGDIDPAEDGDAPLLLLHLCAQAGEAGAWRPLLEFLARPAEELEHALGDTLTDTLPRVLVSLFDDDLEPLAALVVDPAADGHVRWSALDAALGLHARGRIDAASLAAMLEAVAEAGLEPDDAGWSGGIQACGGRAAAPGGDPALAERARDMFASGKAAPYFDEGQDIEDDLRRWAEDPERLLHETRPIEDAVAELSAWHGFTEAGIAERRKAARLGGSVGRDTVVDPYRGIGRNDPCPCGSGRKFKKCHGA